MPVLIHVPDAAGPLLLGAALLLPLACALSGLAGRVSRFAPLAALPALILSLASPIEVPLDHILLGTRFATGGASSVWLFVTAALWICSAWYAGYYMKHDPRRAWHDFFFYGAMAGNLGLVVAREPVAFITFFALMSFMSYGLVIHDRRPASLRAGRVYLGMAVLGEVLQFTGLARVLFPVIGNGGDATFQSLEMLTHTDAVSAVLFIAGFGIKAGLLGLHMWLPMAHPVAPTPASAVLSGSMIKAGLIGWMNLLPLGFAALPGTGQALIVLGLAGAFGAALAGVVQQQAKAVLAYSSVSQMGLIITVFGVALADPSVWPALQWVVVIYAAHHAAAKCLLFLSVGLKSVRPVAGGERVLFWAGTGLAALALAGAPLTSGMAAKAVLKSGLAEAGLPWVGVVIGLLTWAAVGTTLLMARYVHLIREIRHDAHHAAGGGIWLPWVILLVLVAGFAWSLVAVHAPEMMMVWAKAAYGIKAAWPVFVGVLLYAGLSRLPLLRRPSPIVPPGDLYEVLARMAIVLARVTGSLWSMLCVLFVRAGSGWRVAATWAGQGLNRVVAGAERGLIHWPAGSMLAVLVGALFFWLAFR